jgi:MFS family permease
MHGKAMTDNTANEGRRRRSRWRIAAWGTAAALILLIPFVLTLLGDGVEGHGWHWTLGDFLVAFVLLFGTGLASELLASKSANAAYRCAVGIAVVAALLLVWVNAAVGMIGDDNPANVLYVGVIAVGIMGASITRLHLHGMARTLCVMAMAQMVVPVLALILWPTDFAPGVVGVFALNGVFAALWLLSAWLFRQAAREHTPAGAAP